MELFFSSNIEAGVCRLDHDESGHCIKVLRHKCGDQIKSAVDHIVEPSLERGSTGQSSSIIKVGLDYSIQIIRK